MEQAAQGANEAMSIQAKSSIRWFVGYVSFHAAVVLATIPFAFTSAEDAVVQLRLRSVLQLIAHVGLVLIPAFGAMFVYLIVKMLWRPELLWRIVVPDGVLFAIHLFALIRASQ